jgi:hypothetical protein
MSTLPPPPETSAGVRRLIVAGAEVAGGAVGGALGFFAAGPLGAAALGAASAAAAAALKHIGEEASERLLGPREQVRVGGVLALIAAEVSARSDAGEPLRTDGFFQGSGRNAAEEIAEAVLLKAQKEVEEKKLQYLAHLYATIAFDSSISAPLAHQLIKAAEQLSYRQLCLIRLGAVKQLLPLRTTDYRGHGSFSKELYQVLFELHDLYNRGFVAYGGTAALGPSDAVPSQITPQGIGADLHNAMRLAEIPWTEIQALVQVLR